MLGVKKVMVQVLDVCELLHLLAAVLPLTPEFSEFERLDEGTVSYAYLVEQAEAAFGTVSEDDVHQARGTCCRSGPCSRRTCVRF